MNLELSNQLCLNSNEYSGCLPLLIFSRLTMMKLFSSGLIVQALGCFSNSTSESSCTAVEIEAMASTRDLEFALEVGIDRAVVEEDLKMVVQALVSKEFGLASYRLLVKDAYVVANNFS